MKTILRELKPNYYAIEYDNFLGWGKITAVLDKTVEGCDVFSMTPVIWEEKEIDQSLIQLWLAINDNGHFAEDKIRCNILDDLEAYRKSGNTNPLYKTYYGSSLSKVSIKYFPEKQNDEGCLEKPWLWVSYYFM